MAKTPSGGQSGGVSNTGIMNTGGHVVGGNMTVNSTTTFSPTQIHNALQPVADAIKTAPPEKRADAEARFDDLKKELAKGDRAEDGIVAKLTKGLAGLVPSGVGAIVSAFGTPILGGIAGPVTKFVLDELQGDR
jgi:hypothetical protein